MKQPDLPKEPHLEELLRTLHTLRPAALPPHLHTRLSAPPPPQTLPSPENATRNPLRWLLPLAAAVALAATLTFWQTQPHRTEHTRPSAAASPPQTTPQPEPQTASPFLRHYQKLLHAEKAGTTASAAGAYQIVKFTVLHQTWDTSTRESPRMLAQTTAEEFVALPLEVF